MTFRTTLLAVTTVLTVAASTTVATAQSIFDAITHDDVDLVRAHIANGADVNEVSETTGTRPLHYAAQNRRLEIVAELLKAGADPNARTETRTWLRDRGTALHHAADGGNVEIVIALLRAGADPNAKDGAGWTPLHYAAFDGHAQIVTRLLDAGADPKATDGRGRTPLMINDQFHKRLSGSVHERLK